MRRNSPEGSYAQEKKYICGTFKMPKKTYAPFFRELSAVDTSGLQKQGVFVKWIHSLLAAPQSRLSDNSCIES